MQGCLCRCCYDDIAAQCLTGVHGSPFLHQRGETESDMLLHVTPHRRLPAGVLKHFACQCFAARVSVTEGFSFCLVGRFHSLYPVPPCSAQICSPVHQLSLLISLKEDVIKQPALGPGRYSGIPISSSVPVSTSLAAFKGNILLLQI